MVQRRNTQIVLICDADVAKNRLAALLIGVVTNEMRLQRYLLSIVEVGDRLVLNIHDIEGLQVLHVL